MLVPRIDRSHPHARAFGTFWLMAHAPAATIDGWRVAIWSETRPSVRAGTREPGPGEIKAVVGWPASATEPRTCALPISELSRLGGLDPRTAQVVLARHDVPPEVESVLRAIGFEREIPEQVPGWWLLHETETPEKAARGRPASALLLNEDRTRALVLVEVNGRFIVLSTRALWSYTFGPPLAQGETLRFVAREPDGALNVRRLTLGQSLAHDAVREAFGSEPAHRLRRDGQAVTVHVTPDPR